MDSSLANEVHRLYIIRFCQLAASVAALYDHVLTFNDEIQYIWKKKWSLTKCLFLATRYLGTAMLLANAIVFMSNAISDDFCYIYTRVQALTSVLLILLVQAIMQYRLYAIYERSRTLVMGLGALWFLETVGIGVVLGMVATDGVAAETRIPGTSLGICTPTNVPDYFYTFWIPIMTFESVMFALAAYKGFSHIVQFAKYGDWWCPAMLSGVLVRDSIVYFSFNFTAYLLATLLWALLPPEYIEVPEGFTVGITCVMGARMILNLREAYARAPAVSVFTTETPGVSDIGWVPDPVHDGNPDGDEDLPVRPVWWMKPPETRRQCMATNASGSKPSVEALNGARKVDATYTVRQKRLQNNRMRMAGGLGRRRQEESMMQFARIGRETGTFASDVEMSEVKVSPVTAVTSEKSKGKAKSRAPPSVNMRSFGSVVSDVGSMVFGTGPRTLNFRRASRDGQGASTSAAAQYMQEPETPSSATMLVQKPPLTVETDRLPPVSAREFGPKARVSKSEETLLGTPRTPRWDRVERKGRAESTASGSSSRSSGNAVAGQTWSGRNGLPGTFSF